MILSPGTRLGVYEIVAQIGEGGMGQVFRATDTKLKRQVAIKILPPSLAADHDRLARFQREAEILASLNHPHIAGIHGLTDSDGVSALVMELVDGEDLSQRIARGAIPIDEALPIAKQIAEALEAAHEHGIVHRDLKPANIKVRGDGTVKVLDFGLAKAIDSGASGASGATSPTITSPPMTMRGMILGTAAYMSPEQARGKVVDRRTDIWAFGCVLFEMLTGRRAFPGDDMTDVLAAVVRAEPDWSLLPRDVSPTLIVFLRRCLQKDANWRLGDIHDMRLALEGAFDTAPPSFAPLTPQTPHKPIAWMAALAIASLIAAALAIPAVRYLQQTPPPETRVEIVTPATAQPTSFALSPDGRQIAYVASDDKASRLWLRSLSTTTAQPLKGTEGATYPFWSPDGRSIGFFAAGALKRLDIGGAPQTLAPAANGRGGTWNADGVIVFAPHLTGPLMRVSATGGTAKAVTTLGPRQAGHFDPHFLPDGQRLLFAVDGSPDVDGIYLGELGGGSLAQLVSDVSSGVYAPAGWLLWVRTGALIAQRLDVQRAALIGEPMSLAEGVATDTIGGRIAVSVAATGLVAYRTSGSAQRQFRWFDRSGAAGSVVGEPDDTLVQPVVSPDGRRVSMVRTVQDNRDVWLLDGERASRFTFDPSQDHFAVWSPDGTRIAYRSRGTPGTLVQKLTNGAGVEEPLLSTDEPLAATSWSKDGRFLTYFSINPQTNADIWVVPMSGPAADRKPFVFLQTPFREAYGVISPDGRWLAYHSNESGRPEIYVRPFVPPGAAGTAAAAGGQWQVSTDGGIHALWRSDGKELYYINRDGAMMAAPITVNGITLEAGAAVMLFATRIFGGGADVQLGRQYDATADGRFLINTVLSDAAPITLLQNWNPDAKR